MELPQPQPGRPRGARGADMVDEDIENELGEVLPSAAALSSWRVEYEKAEPVVEATDAPT